VMAYSGVLIIKSMHLYEAVDVKKTLSRDR
jgi:hypothetical protein